MLPQTFPNSSPNPSKWIPGACLEQIQGRVSNFVSKSFPNGVPGAGERAPFGLHFRLLFPYVFKQAPKTFPDTKLQFGSIFGPLGESFSETHGKVKIELPPTRELNFQGPGPSQKQQKTDFFKKPLQERSWCPPWTIFFSDPDPFWLLLATPMGP